MNTYITGEQVGDIIRNAAPVPQTEAAAADDGELFGPVIAEIKARTGELMAIPGVIGIRPGFRTVDGESMEEPAIIVVTRPGADIGEIPRASEIYVETRRATAQELVEGLLPLSVWEGVMPEAAPNIHYSPPDPDAVSLREVKVHNITCHIGPDSGWSTLRSFLEGTTEKLTVAMYEFYADHIIETVTSLGEETEAAPHPTSSSSAVLSASAVPVSARISPA